MEFWRLTHVTATLAPDETVMRVTWRKTETRSLKSGDQGRGADEGQAFCDFFFFFPLREGSQTILHKRTSRKKMNPIYHCCLWRWAYRKETAAFKTAQNPWYKSTGHAGANGKLTFEGSKIEFRRLNNNEFYRMLTFEGEQGRISKI